MQVLAPQCAIVWAREVVVFDDLLFFVVAGHSGHRGCGASTTSGCFDWPNQVPCITSEVLQSKAGKLFGARPPYLLFAVARRYYVLLAERVGLAHFFSWGQ